MKKNPRQLFTELKICKKCAYNMENNEKSFRQGRAMKCPSCGSRN